MLYNISHSINKFLIDFIIYEDEKIKAMKVYVYEEMSGVGKKE